MLSGKVEELLQAPAKGPCLAAQPEDRGCGDELELLGGGEAGAAVEEVFEAGALAEVEEALGEVGEVEDVRDEELAGLDEGADAVGDVEGETDGGVDGGPHAAVAHVGDSEAVDGHGDGVDGFVAGAGVDAVAAEVGEAELGGVEQEVAGGGEEGCGVRCALEIVGGTVELGECGEVEVVKNKWDIDGLVGVGDGQSAGSTDAERDGLEGGPEVVEGVDGERVAVDEEGFFEGRVAVEVQHLAGGRAVLAAKVDAVGEEVAELGVQGVGDDGPHEGGVVEDERACEGFGHLDVAGLAVSEGDDSAGAHRECIDQKMQSVTVAEL